MKRFLFPEGDGGSDQGLKKDPGKDPPYPTSPVNEEDEEDVPDDDPNFNEEPGINIIGAKSPDPAGIGAVEEGVIASGQEKIDLTGADRIHSVDESLDHDPKDDLNEEDVIATLDVVTDPPPPVEDPKPSLE